MPRLLFEKKEPAIWISHLDLMRLFQRAFKRAGLPLKHTQGFNPRPSVSIALPLSVGISSRCELLDFELDGVSVPAQEICDRLNAALTAGIRVLDVLTEGKKIRDLAYMDCVLTFEYDNGVPEKAMEEISSLFERQEVLVEKKSKNGITEQNIVPMIKKMAIDPVNQNELELHTRICCQNPSLNPMQIYAAVAKYQPENIPDFVSCARMEIYDLQENIFR